MALFKQQPSNDYWEELIWIIEKLYNECHSYAVVARKLDEMGYKPRYAPKFRSGTIADVMKRIQRKRRELEAAK